MAKIKTTDLPRVFHPWGHQIIYQDDDISFREFRFTREILTPGQLDILADGIEAKAMADRVSGDIEAADRKELFVSYYRKKAMEARF